MRLLSGMEIVMGGFIEGRIDPAQIRPHSVRLTVDPESVGQGPAPGITFARSSERVRGRDGHVVHVIPIAANILRAGPAFLETDREARPAGFVIAGESPPDSKEAAVLIVLGPETEAAKTGPKVLGEAG